MKNRKGFVSNSSTSSFCIYGTNDFSFGDPIEFYKTIRKEFPEQFKELLKDLAENYGGDDSDEASKKIIAWMQGGMEGNILEATIVRGCEHPIKEGDEEKNKFCSECGKLTWVMDHVVCEDDIESVLMDDTYWLMEYFPELTYVSDGDVMMVALGFDYSKAPDDMTFGEFRKRAKKMISKFAGKELECKHIAEEYSC